MSNLEPGEIARCREEALRRAQTQIDEYSVICDLKVRKEHPWYQPTPEEVAEIDAAIKEALAAFELVDAPRRARRREAEERYENSFHGRLAAAAARRAGYDDGEEGYSITSRYARD